MERKKEERKKQLLLEDKVRKESEASAAKEAVGHVGKSRKNMEQREKQLEKEEEGADEDYEQAERLLEVAARNLRTATEGAEVMRSEKELQTRWWSLVTKKRNGPFLAVNTSEKETEDCDGHCHESGNFELNLL